MASFYKMSINSYLPGLNALADLIQAQAVIQGTDPDVEAIADTIERLPMEQEIATEWVRKQPKPNLNSKTRL